jgi:UDP-glucose 4-epimerase
MDVVSLDRKSHGYEDPRLTTVRGDIRNVELLGELFRAHKFAGVVHADTTKIKQELATGSSYKPLLNLLGGTRHLLHPPSTNP